MMRWELAEEELTILMGRGAGRGMETKSSKTSPNRAG